VTHAYKALLAEKQALEITLKAFKAKPTPSNGSAATSNTSGSLRAPTATAAGASEPGSSTLSSRSVSTSDISEQEANGEQPSLVATEEASNSEEKVAALTANIQLLLEHKSKLEQSYQIERKKLRVFCVIFAENH
jgi:hypothetical protein